MGAVFQVHDQRSGRRLALKRLRAEDGDTARLWFEREYFTLSELAHPRIIEVCDYGIDAEGAYYTMELLDGADLREKKNLPVPEICAILCDIACSLAILHSRGLLHRDVSPRNVRCTADGRAKLIDFGAMAAMGIAHEVVGTPPCVPPEALELQALDGRSDLYALGVIAYWMLTGRYPYPARKMAELRELWASGVVPPDRLSGQVTEQLSQLVLQLISLEPQGRPRTAGEVIERLSAIGGFVPEDQERIAGAYLSTPGLVGRAALLAWARAGIGAMGQRAAETLVIEGDAGLGRTRALEVCVAEAKRIGAIVAKASAAADRDYGVMAALGRQLLVEVPQSESGLSAQERAALGHVLEELRVPGAGGRSFERRHVQAAFRDWILGLARRYPILLAVDDIEQVDEPSAALLGMLAHEVGRRGPTIAVTRTPGADDGLALDVLTRLGARFRLTPLAESETEDLVKGVFGDVPNVVAVARRVHGVARGNPRDSMQLLRHLIECGAARCEGSIWLLPPGLEETDLPSSMLSAFEARLTRVPVEARELAEALALADLAWLKAKDYPELMGGADPARLFSMLDTLVQAGILLPERTRYRFSERNAPARLAEAVPEQRKRDLHARLALLAGRRGARIRRLHHLLESGQPALAIDEMLNELGTDAFDYSPDSVDILKRAIRAGDRLPVPETSRLMMKLRLAGVSAVLGDLETFQACAPACLARLRRDSGLEDWERLSDTVPGPERLQTALAQAEQRFQATPEPERGFTVIESMRRLARLLAGYTAMASVASDYEMLVELPSLEPFFVLSPALQVTQSLVDAQLALVVGRTAFAIDVYQRVLARIAEPDGAQLEPAVLDQIKHGVTHLLAVIDAASGKKRALELAEQLDRVPKYRIGAWQIRRAYYRMLGHIEKVQACQRRIELLGLRDGFPPQANVTLRTDLSACWLTDDLTGLKNSFSLLDKEVICFPRLGPLRALVHSHYHRIRGEYALAFQQIEVALAGALPGNHVDWHFVAVAHVELLTLLGKAEQAIEQSEEYEAIFRRFGLELAKRNLELARIRALLAAGRAEEARERCDVMIAEQVEHGTEGILRERFHEARARIALALGDRDGFEHWAGRFAEFCRDAENPAIRAQYQRLMRQVGEGQSNFPLGEAPYESETPTAVERAPSGSVNQRLAECLDRTERAQVALSYVLEACEAKRGHIYGARGGELEHLGSFPEIDTPPDGLQAALTELVAGELTDDEVTEARVPEQSDAGANPVHGRLRELGFVTRLLLAQRSGQPSIVGVLAIGVEPNQSAIVPPRLAETITEVLTERGDVDVLTVRD